MRKARRTIGLGIDLGDQIRDIDQRHVIETQPFHRLGGFRHGGTLRRDDENAVGQANGLWQRSKVGGCRSLSAVSAPSRLPA
jgi:hypothetical protein